MVKPHRRLCYISADRITRRRADLGQTQEQAAAECGVSLRTFTRWERGEASPDAAHLWDALRWLGLKLVPCGKTSSPRRLRPSPSDAGGGSTSTTGGEP